MFRTTFSLPAFPFTISFENEILSLGSCFAENIAYKLAVDKFQIKNNPFGILYNPASIAQGLERIIEQKAFTEKDVFKHNDLWHSRMHHSSFSTPNQTALLEKINTDLNLQDAYIKEIDYLFITFGTAFVWQEKETNTIVANCHKRPQKEFIRRRLSTIEIIQSLNPILQKIKAINPKLQVLLTVSPVRHTNDGFIENQRSKASLILAIDELKQQEYIHYFPAYELVLDDLRDYRFYAADMLHPNDLAVNYIYDKFLSTFLNEATRALLKRIKTIQKAAAHRPFNPNTVAHRNFILKNKALIEVLQKEYPFLDFTAELKAFDNAIA